MFSLHWSRIRELDRKLARQWAPFPAVFLSYLEIPSWFLPSLLQLNSLSSFFKLFFHFFTSLLVCKEPQSMTSGIEAQSNEREGWTRYIFLICNIAWLWICFDFSWLSNYFYHPYSFSLFTSSSFLAWVQSQSHTGNLHDNGRRSTFFVTFLVIFYFFSNNHLFVSFNHFLLSFLQIFHLDIFLT